MEQLDGVAVESIRVSGNVVRLVAATYYDSGDHDFNRWAAYRFDLDSKDLTIIADRTDYDLAVTAISLDEIGR